jgi:hypothetical protein
MCWIGTKQHSLTHSLTPSLPPSLPPCDKACVKTEDFWNVVEDSLAKKNIEKDKKFRYVFHNNFIILYLR